MYSSGTSGEIIAVIPARGGSKALPCKNIRPLGGKPLVAWSIGSALSEAGISRVVVSTDDEDIAAVATEYGAWVPFLRPQSLSEDTSPIGAAIGHTVARLVNEFGIFVRGIVALYPTSPFRNPQLLRSAVAALASNEVTNFGTLKPIQGPMGRFAVSSGRTLLPLKRPENSPNCLHYRPYGLVQAWTLVRGANRRAGYRYAVVDDPVQLIDIDTEEDFRRAEAALRGGLYEFESR